jgi:hypothetical protein
VLREENFREDGYGSRTVRKERVKIERFEGMNRIRWKTAFR